MGGDAPPPLTGPRANSWLAVVRVPASMASTVQALVGVLEPVEVVTAGWWWWWLRNGLPTPPPFRDSGLAPPPPPKLWVVPGRADFALPIKWCLGASLAAAAAVVVVVVVMVEDRGSLGRKYSENLWGKKGGWKAHWIEFTHS